MTWENELKKEMDEKKGLHAMSELSWKCGKDIKKMKV
jgi:hypothetical protein